MLFNSFLSIIDEQDKSNEISSFNSSMVKSFQFKDVPINNPQEQNFDGSMVKSPVSKDNNVPQDENSLSGSMIKNYVLKDIPINVQQEEENFTQLKELNEELEKYISLERIQQIYTQVVNWEKDMINQFENLLKMAKQTIKDHLQYVSEIKEIATASQGEVWQLKTEDLQKNLQRAQEFVKPETNLKEKVQITNFLLDKLQLVKASLNYSFIEFQCKVKIFAFESDNNKMKNPEFKITINDEQQVPYKTGFFSKKFEDGSIYEGNFYEGKQEGYGTMTYSNGNRYGGFFFNNKRQGKGTLYFVNGSRYEGNFKDDKRDGFGKHFFTNGNIYQGEWKDDKKNGQGVLLLKSGEKYIGYWENDFRHGLGISSWPDGEACDGLYYQGKFQGIGKYIWADGTEYIGEWVQDNMHGYGLYSWPNGNRYEGEYKDHLRDGKGWLIYENGDKYYGEWNQNNKHGKGKMIYSNGTIKFGFWNNGSFIKWDQE